MGCREVVCSSRRAPALNENLDWTADMGEAFMNQRTEVLDAVQRMRGKAYENGSLKTTEQQTVTQQPDKIIVIQPSDPEVIYVPQYQSTVVYGSAWAYPTYYYPPAYYGWGYEPWRSPPASLGSVGAAVRGGGGRGEHRHQPPERFSGRTNGPEPGRWGRGRTGGRGPGSGNQSRETSRPGTNSGASNKSGSHGGGCVSGPAQGYGSGVGLVARRRIGPPGRPGAVWPAAARARARLLRLGAVARAGAAPLLVRPRTAAARLPTEADGGALAVGAAHGAARAAVPARRVLRARGAA